MPITLSPPRTEAPKRADAEGDPLPEGARYRLGTLRLRLMDSWAAPVLSPAATGKELHCLDFPRGYGTSSVVFSPDGKLLAAAGGSPAVCLWNLATGTELRQLSRLPFFVTAIAFSPDSAVLAAATPEGPLCLFDIATGKERRLAEPPLLDQSSAGRLARSTLRWLDVISSAAGTWRTASRYRKGTLAAAPVC